MMLLHKSLEECVGFVSDSVRLRFGIPAQYRLGDSANRRTIDDEVFEHECVEAGTDETSQGIDWSADYRLVIEIERGVEQDRTTCQPVERAEQSCKSRICFLVDSLHASRSVNVRNCRKLDRRLYLARFQ